MSAPSLTAPLAPLVQAFFVEHLASHRRASPQTISAYRDAFRLLLRFLRETTGIAPVALPLSRLDVPTLLSFLDHLERDRGCVARSRNARLAAFRSFFRFVTLRVPEALGLAMQILAIPRKRTDRPLVGYLSRAEVEAIIAAPDQSTLTGRRDHALLLVLYNSGARVSEIARLRRSQICLGPPPLLHLEGKGRKERAVPLWTKTGRVLAQWLRARDATKEGFAFCNARGAGLTRDGIAWIVERAVARAATTCPSLLSKRVSPHVLRHTTAMHLLQSGVDVSVIALWLGHESIETTHVYLEADLATKERALARLAPVPTNSRRFTPDDQLLAFLERL